MSMLQWYGHPCVLGIPIPKTLVIWASPLTLTLTLTQIAKVIWKGNAHIAVTSLLRRYKPQGILVPRASWGPQQENGTGYTFLAKTFLRSLGWRKQALVLTVVFSYLPPIITYSFPSTRWKNPPSASLFHFSLFFLHSHKKWHIRVWLSVWKWLQSYLKIVFQGIYKFKTHTKKDD